MDTTVLPDHPGRNAPCDAYSRLARSPAAACSISGTAKKAWASLACCAMFSSEPPFQQFTISPYFEATLSRSRAIALASWYTAIA